MGLPINRLICASNRNDVLAQFIGTGVYDRNRPFYTTISPSMDILVSSNLERLLYELSGKDGGAVSGFMSALQAEGLYEIPAAARDEISRIFAGGRCSEDETLRTIAETYKEHNYLIDTHTAVAYKVLSDYRADTGDSSTSVVVSTASPFKFCESVLEALGRTASGGGAELLEVLAKESGNQIPKPLAALKEKTPRFTNTIKRQEMAKAVKDFLREGN
jgi:threonine synthase